MSKTTGSKATKLLTGHTLGPIFTVDWSVDGRRLGSGAKDEAIRIWNPERADYAKASAELKGHSGRVNQLRWDPTHPERLASAGEDGTLRFWDIRQGSKPTRTVENEHKFPFLNLSWHPNASVIAIGDSKDKLHFFEAGTGRKLGDHKESMQRPASNEAQKDQINEVAFSHDGSALLVPTGAGALNVYQYCINAEGNVQLDLFHTAMPHACVINCTALDPKGRYIALGGADSIVSIIDFRGFFCACTIAHLESEVRSVSFSHDGETLAIAGKDSFIDLSAVANGRQIRRLDAGGPVTAVAWHPSKHLLAWGSDDKIVRVASV